MIRRFDMREPLWDSMVPNSNPRKLENFLENSLAVCFEHFFSQKEVADILARFYKARHLWTSGFDGEQFALGEVWYHYRDTDGLFEDYTAKAADSIKTFNTILPTLYPKIVTFLRQVLAPAPVDFRDGYAGPGIVIFPPDEYVAKNGGPLHYDWEGLLPEEYKNNQTEAYSFVSMLSKPQTGGNLRIVDTMYDPSRDDNMGDLIITGMKECEVDYLPGEMWMFRSMMAHGIQSFTGEKDRVCLTFHLLKRDEKWLLWF